MLFHDYVSARYRFLYQELIPYHYSVLTFYFWFLLLEDFEKA